jgi:branched-chain amino acid transport system ATP-binding protein
VSIATTPGVIAVGRGQGAPALQVDGLQSRYGKSLILAGIDLAVYAGEVAVVLGRNGAGKTTALRTIAGVHPALAGRVLLQGREVTSVPPYRRVRAGLALVPSGARAFGPLPVEANLLLVRGRTPATEKRWDLDAVYELFPPLRKLRHSASGSLSGGERQMLAVGRALMANPTVMMLDEPSEGLAPVIVQAIGGLIGQLRESGIAILLAEQNHHIAMRVADYCYFIEKGRIADGCRVQEAREHDLVRRYLGV